MTPPLPRPEPGWSPPRIGSPGECMRLAFACATGIRPMKINYIPPEKGTPSDFWQEWFDEAKRLGFWLSIRDPDPHDGYWIAVVPSNAPGAMTSSHAVVMKGRKLHYDCNQGSRYARKRRPSKFLFALNLAPLDA